MRSLPLACVVLGLGLVGCSSDGDTRLHDAPKAKYDPDEAAQILLKDYDKNSSGSLEPSELGACPALYWAFAAVDSDRDKKLSPYEIKVRIQAYANLQEGSVAVGCVVTLDGNPLPGATVTFVPEACMGGKLPTASGKANELGYCDQFAVEGKTYRGLGAGLYKIQVTKEGVSIPARFNTQTTLGRELYPDPRAGQPTIELPLSSR